MSHGVSEMEIIKEKEREESLTCNGIRWGASPRHSHVPPSPPKARAKPFSLYICKRFGDIEEYRTIVAMLRLTVARRGVLHISRRASRICSSSIATLNARGSIGRSIKKHANDVPPSYATRRCSRTRRRRRTAPFASYQCHTNNNLCLASTRDYIFRSNLRLRGSK